MKEKVISKKPVPYQEGTIEARNARICYDAERQKIIVSSMKLPEPRESKKLPCSTGACYGKWQENCRDQKNAMIILLKQYYTFTYIWNFPVEVVENAFAEIVEWNEAWAKEELKSGEEGW